MDDDAKTGAEDAEKGHGKIGNRQLVDAGEWLERNAKILEELPKEAHPPKDGKHGEHSYTLAKLVQGKPCRIEVHCRCRTFRLSRPKVKRATISWGDDVAKARTKNNKHNKRKHQQQQPQQQQQQQSENRETDNNNHNNKNKANSDNHKGLERCAAARSV